MLVIVEVVLVEPLPKMIAWFSLNTFALSTVILLDATFVIVASGPIKSRTYILLELTS